jgi:ABC-2 type transport system permease protein
MSAVEAPTAAAIRPPRLVSPRFLLSELMLIFGRRRNWVGLGVLAALPILLSVAMKFSHPADNGRGGGGGPDFVSMIAGNGFFVALAALTVEIGLFLPIAVAAISADAIAGEANSGTLRYLLAVPVHRTRMLAVKYTAIVIFTAAATLLVAATGVVIGLALFGGGPVTLLSGSTVSLAAGIGRLLIICAYLTVCLSALGAIGLFVSTLTEQPIAATIATVMLSVSSFIADNIPQISWLHPYLLTHSWTNFGDVLRDPIATDGLRTGVYSALAYIVVFLCAAWARFGGRDVTS